MGLELVEFVMELESTFGLDIPDADAERLETPRLVIEYLIARLPMGAAPAWQGCLSQRAFYRLRREAVRRSGAPRRAIGRATPLRPALASDQRTWRELGQAWGARRWPRLQSDHWATRHLGGVSTFADAAHYLAQHDVAVLRGPDAPWTREEVERLVLEVLERETGIDMRQYTLDSRFTYDMGLG
jgi:hypothetical protein